MYILDNSPICLSKDHGFNSSSCQILTVNLGSQVDPEKIQGGQNYIDQVTHQVPFGR